MNQIAIPTDVSLLSLSRRRSRAAGGRTATYDKYLIHDVNPSQLSGAFYRSSEVSLREALLDARRDTETHRATR